MRYTTTGAQETVARGAIRKSVRRELQEQDATERDEHVDLRIEADEEQKQKKKKTQKYGLAAVREALEGMAQDDGGEVKRSGEGGETYVVQKPPLIRKNKTYATLDRYLIPKTTRLLLLTGTKCVNSPRDLFGAVCWMSDRDPELCREDVWFPPRGSGGIMGMPWVRAQLEQRFFVHVDSPKPPETKVTYVKHALSRKEIELYACAHAEVVRKFTTYLYLRQQGRGQRTREALEGARNAFNCALGRLRRGTIHPLAFLDDEEKSEEQRTKERHRPLSSSKFAKVRTMLREAPGLAGEKVVIFCCFKAPLEMLGAYLCSRGVKRQLFYHFGGQNNQPALRKFHRAKAGALLLATRASMRDGVNIPSATRVLCLDLDFSRSQEEQARARVKRPLVQPADAQWTAHYVVSDHTIEAYMMAMQNRKASSISVALGEAHVVDWQSKDLASLSDACPPLPPTTTAKQKSSNKRSRAEEEDTTSQDTTSRNSKRARGQT